MTQEIKVIKISDWDASHPIPDSISSHLSKYDTQITLTSPKKVMTNQNLNQGSINNQTQASEDNEDHENDQEEDIEENSSDEGAKSPRHDIENQIETLENAIAFQAKVQEALSGIIKNVEDYHSNIQQIEDIKSSVIDKISKFNDESSKMLDQQQIYIDIRVNVQTIMHYFIDYEKLAKDVDNLGQNIQNIHIYEPNIMRFLSEIMDAIEFFESKTNYKNSQEFATRYDKLKKKLLIIVKNMFIKIFTRDESEISKAVDKFNYEELGISSPDSQDDDFLFNIVCNTELLKLTFPEFQGHFSEDDEDNQASVLEQEGRHISKYLRDLLSYMRMLSNFDADCSQTLDNLFSSFYRTSRKNIQNQIIQNIFQQIHRMPQKKLQNIMAIIITFALQMTFFELIYHNYLFNNQVVINDSSFIAEIIIDILDNYYEYIFGFIQMENNIQNIFEAIDALNFYIDPAALDIATADAETNENQGGNQDSNEKSDKNQESQEEKDQKKMQMREENIINMIISKLVEGHRFEQFIQLQKKKNSNGSSNLDTFIDVYVTFLGKIKGDVNTKLLDMLKYYMEKYLMNYNLNNYWKEFDSKYNAEPEPIQQGEFIASPYFRVDMKGEIFQLVKTTTELLLNLKNRIDENSFQDLASQMATSAINYCYMASDLFKEKTDAFLFLLKNLYYLNQKLAFLDVKFQSQELQQEQDENGGSGGGLLNMIKHNIPFFGAKKTSNKMLELGVDLKMDPSTHLKVVADRFVTDLEFIISNKIIEYLQRIDYLQELIQVAEQQATQSSLNIEKQTSSSSIQGGDGSQQNVSQDTTQVPGEESISEQRQKRESISSLSELSNIQTGSKKSDAEAALVEMKSWLEFDRVRKYHSMFTDSMDAMMESISFKMNNYLDQASHKFVKDTIVVIVNDLMKILTKFYLFIAENTEEEAYNKFEFTDVAVYRQKIFDTVGIQIEKSQLVHQHDLEEENENMLKIIPSSKGENSHEDNDEVEQLDKEEDQQQISAEDQQQ